MTSMEKPKRSENRYPAPCSILERKLNNETPQDTKAEEWREIRIEQGEQLENVINKANLQSQQWKRLTWRAKRPICLLKE